MLIVAAIAGGVWLAWPRLFASPITTGPMVQMLAPDGFVLVWQMRPAESASVTVRHEGGESVGVFTADRTDDRCIAEIDGLQEGALYRYEITIAGKSGVPVLLAVGDVRTAPPPGDSFRVIAFGDSGTGKRAQYRLAERMPEYEPDLIIHTGDIVYFDGAAEDYPDHFFRPYASLLSRIPCYPCLGNHDVRTDDGAPALAAFVLPRNGPEAEPPERHYWFDFGDVRFVFIDSNRTFPIYQEVVAPWLDAVLADAGERRTILVFHEPFFTNARHKPAEKLQLSILPVIDRHRVNLALSGHNHLYERTHPIRDGQVVADGEGTVYITTGAGGGRLDEPPT
ncbi:MAG: metallophosphoesterase, partial [Phycisphaerae bacterium]|nr:metallophosphoesterase [Phycisphaerae bacterium]